MISTLMTKTQDHIQAQFGHGQVPRIPCRTPKTTPTVSVQSLNDFPPFCPIGAGWAHGGRVPSRSREGHWDSWGEEACWARMPLVARPYNLERCMQRTARSPFQVEIQEELRTELNWDDWWTRFRTGEIPSRLPFKATRRIDPDVGKYSVSQLG